MARLARLVTVLSLLLACRLAAADGMGRVLDGRHFSLRGMRSAEATVTNADGADRLQGRLQQETSSGLRVEWSQNTDFMGKPLTIGLKADTAKERSGLTELKLGSGILDVGGVIDISGELTYDFASDKANADLVLTSAGGTMVSVAVNGEGSVDEVSAFHRAGPVNLQPRWLPKAQLLRLHVGRGSAFRRCPVSLQADVPLGAAAKPEFELKARRELGSGRMLRTVWLATQRAVVLELQDMATEQGATWVTRVRASYAEGRAGTPELTLRRKWQW